MPVTLLRPQQDPNDQESIMDKILKGAQIAQGVLGVVGGVQEQIDRPEQQRLAQAKAARDAEAFQTQQQLAQAELARTQKQTELMGQEKPMSAMERRFKEKELELKTAQIESAKNKPAALTESQKVFERERAKGLSQYAENRDALKSDIARLKDVREKLAGGLEASGPFTGLVPFKSVFMPEAAEVKNIVDAVTQKNLTKILGGQFAQKEGAEVLKRGFNPNLSEEANLKTLDSLISMMETGMQNREAELAQLEGTGRVMGTKYRDPVTNKQSREVAQDPKIEQYAEQYGMDYSAAAKILEGRGYVPQKPKEMLAR